MTAKREPKLGETVLYKINDKYILPARIMKVHPGASRMADLRVHLTDDDFPEFSKEACRIGNAMRKEVPIGTKPNSWNYQEE